MLKYFFLISPIMHCRLRVVLWKSDWIPKSFKATEWLWTLDHNALLWWFLSTSFSFLRWHREIFCCIILHHAIPQIVVLTQIKISQNALLWWASTRSFFLTSSFLILFILTVLPCKEVGQHYPCSLLDSEIFPIMPLFWVYFSFASSHCALLFSYSSWFIIFYYQRRQWWCHLRLEQTVPSTHLLSFRLLHLSPVRELILAWAVQAQGDPAYHLLTLNAAFVVDGDNECDVWQLEQCHLEDESLPVGGIRLATAQGCLALGHLLTHGVQQGQLHKRVWEEEECKLFHFT